MLVLRLIKALELQIPVGDGKKGLSVGDGKKALPVGDGKKASSKKKN